MPVDDALLASVRENIGTDITHDLGTITAVMIRRYARAIGERNPLYFDAGYARSHGHADIVAPPNFLTAVSIWDEGPPSEDLREDGTPETLDLMGLPKSGVRVMGGGEHMQFHAPVTAGTTVVERTTMADAELRQGRTGEFIVISYRHEFVDEDGRLLVTSIRKVLLR